MVVRSASSSPSANELQELGTIQWVPLHDVFRVYWKNETKEAVIVFNGVESVHADGPILECLASFRPHPPQSVLSCAVYEADGTLGLPMNHLDDLLRCEWSDFACDRLLIQATVA
jgi:hypothetical protein